MANNSGYRSKRYNQVREAKAAWIDGYGIMHVGDGPDKKFPCGDVSHLAQKCSGGHPLVDLGSQYREVTLERNSEGKLICREDKGYLQRFPWLVDMFKLAEAARD